MDQDWVYFITLDFFWGVSYFELVGGIGNLVADVCEIQYEDIPHFPKSTAPGHKSRLLLGTLNKVPVVVMQGRFHLYEGYNIHQVGVRIYPAWYLYSLYFGPYLARIYFSIFFFSVPYTSECCTYWASKASL